MKSVVQIGILLLLSGVFNWTKAQTTGSVSPVALEKITPPTPEAAALGKYGAFPVGLFTGTLEHHM